MQFYISFGVYGVFYHISSKWEGETIIIFVYNYDIKYMMHCFYENATENNHERIET